MIPATREDAVAAFIRKYQSPNWTWITAERAAKVCKTSVPVIETAIRMCLFTHLIQGGGATLVLAHEARALKFADADTIIFTGCPPAVDAPAAIKLGEARKALTTLRGQGVPDAAAWPFDLSSVPALWLGLQDGDVTKMRHAWEDYRRWLAAAESCLLDWEWKQERRRARRNAFPV